MPRLSDETSTKRDHSSYTAQLDVIDGPPKQDLSDFYDDLLPRKAPSENGEDNEQPVKGEAPCGVFLSEEICCANA
jgi:hypothetical protein